MRSKKFIKYSLIKLSNFLPFAKGNSVFVSILNKDNLTGPGRFLFNLENGLANHVKFERRILKRAKAVLIISSAPHTFFDFCKSKKLKTIVRVDGFSLPMLYDNKVYEHRDTREFTHRRILTNQEIQMSIAKGDFIVYQSRFAKSIADQYLFTRNENFQIIHNGVDTELFKPNEKSGTSPVNIGLHGSLRDIDIVKTGLEAYRLFNLEAPESRLFVIGSMTESVHEFFDVWIKKNPDLSEMVTKTGTVDHNALSSVLGQLDIAIHMTYGDACPNAVLENLASGNPVVCVEWGGASELVQDAGIAIDHPRYGYGIELSMKVSTALVKISKDMKKYASKARKLAVEEYSLKTMVDKYRDIFDKQ